MLLRTLSCLIGGWLISVAALADSPRVLTSVQPLQQIAAAVLDGIDQPGLLMPAGSSPHTYALRPSDRRALQHAERIYWVGPELERFLDSLLTQQPQASAMMSLPGLRIREQTQSLNFQSSAQHEHHHHDDGHDHGSLDAHIWLSPFNAVHIATYMASDLRPLYPEDTARLQANLADFEQRLAALDAQIKTRLAPLVDKPYFVFHDGYGYFEDHYGLRARGIFSLSHEIQPGARHINVLRQQLIANAPSCVFSEPQFTPRLINSLTQGISVEQAELDPLGSATAVSARGYEQSLQTLADNLAGCLEQL